MRRFAIICIVTGLLAIAATALIVWYWHWVERSIMG